MPMGLMKDEWKCGTIGASHGCLDSNFKERGRASSRGSSHLDPSALDTDPKRIFLPPLVTMRYCQTQILTNVAMSSSSPEDEDCIVAIKFMGSQRSLCRPAQKNCK